MEEVATQPADIKIKKPMASTPVVLPAKGTHEIPEYGDLIMAYLEQLGVQYVFGIPGGAIEPFYNALARSARRGGPRAITARHETGAAFMADGYHRTTGKLAVCCATTGPGATNLITGVASAYENNIPMLVITAQTALSSFGLGVVQDSSCTGVNTVGLFQHCTRYNTLVSHPAQFENKLINAIMAAFAAPMGPAHLSVPMDVMRAQYTPPEGGSIINPAALLRRPLLLDNDSVTACYRELLSAKNPVFLIGDEAGEAMGLINVLARQLKAKLVTTPHGKGLVSPYHPLFQGVIGFSGHPEAHQALTDPATDSIFIIGARLGEWVTNTWDPRLSKHRLVQIEATETNFVKTPTAILHVRGDIRTVLQKLLDKFAEDAPPAANDQKRPTIVRSGITPKLHFSLAEEDKYLSDASPIKPQRLMRELPRIFPPNTRYLGDSGASLSWSIHYLHPDDRRKAGRPEDRRNPDRPDERNPEYRHAKIEMFRGALDFACMGWATGSAVGVALALRGEPVVCITGDGSMLMNGQEITVAIEEQLPVVFVVLNDNAFGMVKHGQRLTGAEQIGTTLPKTDFAAFAQAMGADAYVIHSPQDLLALDGDAICRRRGPTLLDVRIDPNEVPPIGSRAKTLKVEQ